MNNFSNSAKDLETLLTAYKERLKQQKLENKDLQEQPKESINQSKTLQKENEKLLKMINFRETESHSINTKLKEGQEKGKKSDSEIKSLKSKLADANSQFFILEEENERLKKCVETRNKD